MTNTNSKKPVRITNTKAIQLIQERAKNEGRSLANAAAITIIEALKGKDTDADDVCKDKNN